MNLFHDPKSARQKGTLANIRVVYGHKNVMQNTKKCFNATHEFVEFATTAYVIAAALRVMRTSQVTTIPPDFPSTQEDKLLFLNNVAQKVPYLKLNTYLNCVLLF